MEKMWHNLLFAQVDCSAWSSICEKYSLSEKDLPLFVWFKDSEMVEAIDFESKNELVKLVKDNGAGWLEKKLRPVTKGKSIIRHFDELGNVVEEKLVQFDNSDKSKEVAETPASAHEETQMLNATIITGSKMVEHHEL